MRIWLRFITTCSLVSAAIRFATWSDYSHVEFVLPEGYLGAHLDKGVAVRPFDYTEPTRAAYAFVQVPEEVGLKTLAFARDQIGKPYDSSAIAGMLFRRDWHEPDSWFCSELVAAAFAAAGHKLVDDKLNRVTPRDLAIVLSPEGVPC